MSHRLIEGAPAGYHPQARDFDEAFVAALIRTDWAGALEAEPRQLAAEDVVTSSAMAMAAVRGPLNAELLAYEGPWGVGYSEAIFYDPAPPLYAIARSAVRALVHGQSYQVPEDGPPATGIFVTLRRNGELRGCIGHLEPVGSHQYQEVATLAQAAASRDPRMKPVGPDELADLDIEISVLGPMEVVASEADLDGRVYGVVVSRDHRRGVLLPNVPGFEEASAQVAIARRKAGIRPSEPVQLERFRVDKIVPP